MRAELLKIRSMPTPLWTLVALGLCFLGGAVASVAWGIGEDDAVLDIAIGLPTMIASLVFGSWLAGVEFGQNTLRRSLAADPRRPRFVLAKLGAMVAVVTSVTLGLLILGYLVFAATGSGHPAPMDTAYALKIVPSTLITNLTYGICALSLTLLTRSMAGGLTLTFAFFFVIDGVISLLPKVGDFTVGIAQTDVDAAIRGSSEGIFDQAVAHDAWLASITLAAWLVVFLAAGLVRTLASDVK